MYIGGLFCVSQGVVSLSEDKTKYYKNKNKYLRTKKNALEQKGCLKSIFKYMQV